MNENNNTLLQKYILTISNTTGTLGKLKNNEKNCINSFYSLRGYYYNNLKNRRREKSLQYSSY